jgi:predicted phage tail component-like protein
VGLSFKDIHSDTMGVVTQITNNPIVSSVKTETYSPQGMDGTIDYSDINGRYYYDDKIVEVKMQVKAKSFKALVDKCSNLALWLQGKGDLVLDKYPSRVYKARVLNTIDFTPQLMGHYAELNVQFRCEPFAYDENNPQSISGTQTAGDSTDAEAVVTVNNVGFYVPPTIKIKTDASTVNIAIWVNNVKKTEYSGAASNLKIYNDIQEVYNGSSCVSSSSNCEFFELAPGNNTVEISCTASFDYEIQYTPRYL